MKSKRMKAVAAILLLALWGMATTGWAQRSAVTQTEEEISGVTRQGQRIMLQLDSKVVEKAWENFLKEKTGGAVKGPSFLPLSKTPKGVYTVENARLDTISSNPMRIVSKVDGTKDGTMVWWSMDLGNAYLSQENTAQEWERSEAMLQQFARNLYRQDVQQQIADAEKALAYSQSEADKVVKQAEDLKNKIAKNQQKKQELEAALVTNAKDLEQLNRDVETNAKQQEAAQQSVSNMRQAVE